MRTDLTEEKLTAFVLGELDDEERAAVEDALDEEARRTVEELRATAALAEAALAVEPAPALTEEQRGAIAQKASDAPVRPGSSSPLFWIVAAAGLLLFVGGSTMVLVTGLRMQPMADKATSADVVMAEEYMPDAVADSQSVDMPAKPAEPMLVRDPEPERDMGTDIPHDTEAYDAVTDNPFLDASRNPLSTFSIDVDTASYSNVRRILQGGNLPPAGAVRIEELVNYFDYDYEGPTGDDPFAADVEVAGCPWAADHRLVRVGLKGWEMHRDERPASNLVFLIDVSGSMKPQNKLPLLVDAMELLVQQLGPEDRVAMVVYSGASGLVLDSTACDAGGKRRIVGALDRLDSGGSTAGGAGIRLAYETAARHYIEGGTNRVILASDGDFNVGETSHSDLVELIEDKAETGVFLTVLGFGMGNYKDSTLEKLADKGNGNYAYIDNHNEARKVLVEEMSATLVTIAKDVKIQVEFNPAEVNAYRLIGYENRLLAAEDFKDDTVDAGEIGAGHTVTALYEVVPTGVDIELPEVDELRYQQPQAPSRAADSGELLTLKLRYKQPDEDTSKELVFGVEDDDASYAQASGDFQFAAAVAAFGMLLRDSPHRGSTSYDAVLELAEEGQGQDRHGYRAEFLELVRTAKRLGD